MHKKYLASECRTGWEIGKGEIDENHKSTHATAPVNMFPYSTMFCCMFWLILPEKKIGGLLGGMSFSLHMISQTTHNTAPKGVEMHELFQVVHTFRKATLPSHRQQSGRHNIIRVKGKKSTGECRTLASPYTPALLYFVRSRDML
ncbi:unnamed protein product, partial [Ectocarpus sp. 4 AP-2014]